MINSETYVGEVIEIIMVVQYVILSFVYFGVVWVVVELEYMFYL